MNSPVTAGDQVLLITNIPTPYRIPLFNEINRQLLARGIAFKVVFAALGYARRKWQIDMAQCSFPWAVLGGGRVPSRNPESAMFTYSGLGRLLRSDPHALYVVGGFSVATTWLRLAALLRRTRYYIWSGAIERKGRPDSWVRRWHRRWLVGGASGFVAYGVRAGEYLVGLGADASRVFIGINTVDTAYFHREVSLHREAQAPSVGDARHILYVGNLEAGKRLDHLLEVTRLLAQSRSDFVLDIVGSGSQEGHLRELADRLGIAGRVHFHGFVQRPEVARHLARAACFVFPSEYDIWGLVLVEAMSAGLPCVASFHAGATSDLIEDGVTGFAVDFSQFERVAGRLAWLLDHPAESAAIGDRARAFILARVNLKESAAGFVAAVRSARGDDPCVSTYVLPCRRPAAAAAREPRSAEPGEGLGSSSAGQAGVRRDS